MANILIVDEAQGLYKTEKPDLVTMNDLTERMDILMKNMDRILVNMTPKQKL